MNEAQFDQILSWGTRFSPLLITALRIGLILILAWIGIGFAHRLIRTFRMYLSRSIQDAEEVKRITTLGRVFRYIASVLISLIAGTLILGEIGISIAPILGAAGVVGVAVGFGAQSLVKDYFTGFFLLLENQMRQGDVIEAGGHGGVVEEITLRYVRMRDYDGNVHFVPNGTITTVTNKTRGFAYSVIDVGIAYRENIDEALAIMRQVGSELRADPDMALKILEELEIAGVNELGDSAVVLRCRFKTAPIEQWGIRREYLRRIKIAFDTAGVEIPFPHVTVYPGQLKDGASPALRLAIEGTALSPTGEPQ